MNKRQRGLTSAGTFLGLVCGLVLTQQVVSADTNTTVASNDTTVNNNVSANVAANNTDQPVSSTTTNYDGSTS